VSAAADDIDEARTMRQTLKMFVAFTLLTAADVAAPQQASPPAPAPAQSPTQSPQPQAKPPLKLRLDEVERRPAIRFGPKDDAPKKEAAQTLPGMGGNPSKTWDTPAPTTVIPPTNDNY
jgi:hypothetical protein